MAERYYFLFSYCALPPFKETTEETVAYNDQTMLKLAVNFFLLQTQIDGFILIWVEVSGLSLERDIFESQNCVDVSSFVCRRTSRE